MVYNKRDADEIRQTGESVLQSLLDDPATSEFDILGAMLSAYAETIAENQEPTLEEIAGAAFLTTASGTALDLKALEYGIERRPATPATGVVEFSRSSDAPEDFVVPAGTTVQTRDGSIAFQTTEQVTLAQGTQSVQATVEATTGGSETNLPANKLVVMPSPPTGIESVTNPVPTGDDAATDTNGNSLRPGQDRETDEELRERVLSSRSIGGAATIGSIETALLDLDGTQTVTVFTNATESTDENGLPPYSSEVVVSGGNSAEIAETLRDTVAVTELFRLQSGVIANGVTESVYVSALNQTVDVGFSRPTEVSLTVDVSVQTDNFAGADVVADRIVEYVGGTRTDGSVVSGVGAGENVLINRLNSQIVSEETGVVGIGSLTVDATGDGSDDRTTDANGVEIISIGAAKQAAVDASNITVTEL